MKMLGIVGAGATSCVAPAKIKPWSVRNSSSRVLNTSLGGIGMAAPNDYQVPPGWQWGATVYVVLAEVLEKRPISVAKIVVLRL